MPIPKPTYEELERRLDEAHEALRTSHQGLQQEARQRADENDLLRTAIEQLPVSVVMTDARGRIEYVNPAFTKMTGYCAQEALGKNPRLLKSGLHDRAFYGQMWETVLSGAAWHGEVVNRRKDGSHYTQRLIIAAVPDRKGQRSRYVGIGREVTAEKEARRALAASEERHRALLAGLPDLIFVLDAESRFSAYHEPKPSLLFIPPERFVGRSVGEVLPQDVAVRFEAASDVARRTGNTQRMEYTLELAEGTRAFEARVVPMDGGTLTVVARDVTQAKSVEAQLLQAQKMEAVGQLAGGVAHDFNNIITAIISFTGFAKESLSPVHPARDDLDQVLKAGERAAGLVQQLLAFSRRQVVQPRVLNLNDLVLDMGKLLERVVGEHIELATLPRTDLWRTRIDPGQLEQVLVNLAVNARDALPNGGKLTIELGNAVLDEDYVAGHVDARAGEFVMLAVSDNGIGMTPDVRRKIFDPFFTTKEKGRGTGLGLSTCYGIVKQAGGHVAVYSEPGRGTTFKIYLPRARQLEDEVLEVRRLEGELPGGTETILVAEDDASVRVAVARTLVRLGYTLLESTTPAHALRIARGRGEGIDLLITDVVMPEMNGPELALRVRSRHPEVKVLYMSGYTNGAIVHRGELDRGLSFLGKPFLPEALARKVRETLDRVGPGGIGIDEAP